MVATLFFGVFERPLNRPEMVYSQRIFEPFWGCGWGLYAFCVDPKLDDDHDLFHPNIPDSLIAILHGALRYPPAIALAKESICRQEPYEISKEEFCKLVEGRLEEVLRKSATSAWLLAKARTVNCLRRGSYYWLVGYDSRSGQVRFITEEFNILETSAGDFELGSSEMRSLQDLQTG